MNKAATIDKDSAEPDVRINVKYHRNGMAKRILQTETITRFVHLPGYCILSAGNAPCSTK